MFRLFARYILPLLVSAGIAGTGVHSGFFTRLKNSLQNGQVTIVQVSKQAGTPAPTASVTPTPERTQVAHEGATATPIASPTPTAVNNPNHKDVDSDLNKDDSDDGNENSSEEAREDQSKSLPSEEMNESSSQEDQEVKSNDEKSLESSELPVENIQGNEGQNQAQAPAFIVIFDQWGQNLDSGFWKSVHGLHLGKGDK